MRSEVSAKLCLSPNPRSTTWHPYPPPVLGLELQDGRTPLHVAAKWGHKEVVELLLGAGAAVDAVDKVGSAPVIGCMRAHAQGKFARGMAPGGGGGTGRTGLHDLAGVICMTEWVVA
jgi:hypothetical protein